ncbi:ret finger protein-like 4A [Lithobates pipiens]
MATCQGENLFCTLCYNVFSDPVMLNCGHIFCRYCIETVLNSVKGNEIYTCPDCGIQFKRRPVLYTDRKLQDLKERCASQKPTGKPETASYDTLYDGRKLSNQGLPKKAASVSEVCSIHHGTLYRWRADYSVCMPCYLRRFTEDHGMYKLPEQENLKLQNILKELEIKTEKIYMSVNTASKNVDVLECQKMAAYTDIELTQSPSSERFSSPQVLTQTCFSAGLHFFVVEIESSGHWAVGLAYYSIPRTGEKSYIGFNKKSWSLEWDNECLSVSHDSESILISTDHVVRRVGIYLNYSAGQITFFEMSDIIRHLYTFSATFTEPLHAAFYVFEKSWIRIRS